MYKILKPILMTFLTTTAVKRLVIDLLKSIAKQTTNTLDDKAVEILESPYEFVLQPSSPVLFRRELYFFH